MRILQICKKFPYPPKDGEAIAILNLTKSLSELGHDVTVLALNTNKHYFDVSKLPAEVDAMASFHAVDIITDVRFWDAFANLFTRKSYNIERFVSLRFRAKLLELLTDNTYDVVHLETSYLGSYVPTIRKHTDALIVLRSHNVEYEIWQRLAANQRPGIKKWYLNLLARRLKNYELNSLSDYDLMVPISARDEKTFKSEGWSKPSLVLPTGLDIGSLVLNHVDAHFPSVFFIGGMDWLPNVEGVRWFLEHVWKHLKSKRPALRFYIAGRNMPDWMLRLNMEGVEVCGEVEDAHQFMKSATMMVVPLFSGSGMRIKIIEAMALGKPVISTRIGAEGVAYEDGKNLLIADDAESFIECILQLADSKERAEQLGLEGRRLIASSYDNLELTRQLVAFYEKHLDQ